MSGIYQFINRTWTTLKPSRPAKQSTAIRLGLLGASKIAPIAVINPALSHPEVIVAAVAARDQSKAQAYAEKYNIPIIHHSYQELLDDPTIDAVYIPLPNGLHYEWAIKALKAGKHVLVEKPSTSNAEEARKLFNHPILSQPNAPVLLEAFHYRFHPAWQAFLTCLDQPNIKSAQSKQWAPKGVVPLDDIRFQYDLAGGALMDFGTYNVSALRQVFGAEPTACINATYQPMPVEYNEPSVEQAIEATSVFPNGATGTIVADLRAEGNWLFQWLTQNWPRFSLPYTLVEHNEVEKPELATRAEEQHFVQRAVRMWNPLAPSIYHRIDIIDTHFVRDRSDSNTLKTWVETQQIKAYRPLQQGHPGEEWWTTYRHQLEQFVDRVKGREGNGVWVSGDDSIKQMEMIDSIYKQAGLPLRPSSTYFT